MKPKRISMTHSLVDSYELYRYMDVYVNKKIKRNLILQQWKK